MHNKKGSFLVELQSLIRLWQIFGLFPFKISSNLLEIKDPKLFKINSFFHFMIATSLCLYFSSDYVNFVETSSDPFQIVVDHTCIEAASSMFFLLTIESFIMRYCQVDFLRIINDVDIALRKEFLLNPKLLSIKRFAHHFRNLWIVSSIAIFFSLVLSFLYDEEGDGLTHKFMVVYLVPVFYSTLQNVQFLIYTHLILVRLSELNKISLTSVESFIRNGKLESLIVSQQKIQRVYQLITESVERLNANNKMSSLMRNIDGVHRCTYVGALLLYVFLNRETNLMKKMWFCLVATVFNTYVFMVWCWEGHLLADQVRN